MVRDAGVRGALQQHRTLDALRGGWLATNFQVVGSASCRAPVSIRLVDSRSSLLDRVPSLAAAANASTIAVGQAIGRTPGQVTTSTVIAGPPRLAGRGSFAVKKPAAIATIRTTGT